MQNLKWVQNSFKVYGLIRVTAKGAQWQYLQLLWPHTAITFKLKNWLKIFVY